jgi:hypothetical protein
MAGQFALESPTVDFPVSTVLLQRIRAEYSEMPGLCLTVAQAQRLWGLDHATSHAALAALVAGTFLTTTQKGFFVMAATARTR